MILLLAACVLVTPGEKSALLDPDEDGVAWPDDCDGADPNVYPGATEVCDGVDQDCDGEIDEDPSDGLAYYPDVDGDGFGDPESAKTACSAPGSGWTTDDSDCDDAAGAVYPSAPTICADWQLNDCSSDAITESQLCALTGTVNLGSELDGIGVTRLADTSRTGVGHFGAVLIGAGASLTGETGPDQRDGFAVGAPEGEGMAGAAYWTASPYVDGVDYDPDAALALTTWTGPRDAETGSALASIGSACGDGTTTLVVGSPGVSTISLVSTPDALASGGTLARTALLDQMVGPISFGSALGAEGVHGGSTLAVGAPEANSAGYFLFPDAAACSDLLGSYKALYTPPEAVGFGTTVAAADITGDGTSDLLVSGDDDGAAALWFFDGACAALGAECGVRVDLGELRGPVAALQVIDIAGKSDEPCAPDGEFDVVVGAPFSGDDGQGQVMVLEGSASGDLSYDPSGLGVRTGEESGDRFGAALFVDATPLQGQDGDATSILAVGAPGVEVVGENDALDDGAVYGWIGLDAWCGTGGGLDPTFTLEGGEGTNLGAALAKGHDMDGDPADRPELVIGAPGALDGAGLVYVLPIFPY